MTTIAVAPQGARERADSVIDGLRGKALEFVQERGNEVQLSELLGYLRAEDARTELVSRAVAGLLSSGRLLLTSDRRVVLGRQ